MPIKLLSSAGPFDPAFIDALSGLEAGLITNELDPAMFTVSRAEAPMSWGDTEALGYEYTIYVGTEHYIAIMPNDFSFLDFLAEYCTAIAVQEAERANAAALLPVATMQTHTTARFAERLHDAA